MQSALQPTVIAGIVLLFVGDKLLKWQAVLPIMTPVLLIGGMSTEKYTAIAQVSRATAYRELTDLVALGVLVKSGQGRGTRYALSGALEGVSG